MNRQAQEKSLKLIQAIDRKTSAGELSWIEIGDGIFEATVGKYIVRVSEEQGDRGEPVVAVRIFSERGNIVDRFDDESFSDVPAPGSYHGMFKYMTDVHENIARYARGADRAIDDILESFEG